MKTLVRLLAVVIFALALSFAVSAQTRVSFARGAKSKIVSGHMSGYKSQRTYVIRVRAGHSVSRRPAIRTPSASG